MRRRRPTLRGMLRRLPRGRRSRIKRRASELIAEAAARRARRRKR